MKSILSYLRHLFEVHEKHSIKRKSKDRKADKNQVWEIQVHAQKPQLKILFKNSASGYSPP